MPKIKYSKKMMHSVRYIFCASIFLISYHTTLAEPWLDSRDVWLRADIEALSDLGIITVPITTYPIMWSGIVKDFDNTKIEDVPDSYKNTFWRVKKQMRKAFQKRSFESLRLSASSSPQVLRAFGDLSREEAEVSARKVGMGEQWAWNLEVTYALDASDDEDIRLDGSYLATVLGNWNFSAGYVERWWGPTWDSANLVSNNARPTPALMLQRNYSEPFDYNWLKWIGPWTLNTFIGQLDDDRVVADANLIGMSVTFKPLNSLEIGLRRSAQWGGEGRPDDIHSFFNLIIGRDNCESDGISCTVEDNEPGNQLAGIDMRWSLPFEIPSNVYFSAIGEDEAGYMPTKRIYQIGISSLLEFNEVPWKWYLEYSDTAVRKDQFNIAYEHHIYRTGYRYYDRAIGSTYDNDSKAIVAGVIGQLSRSSSLYVRLSSIELNRDSENKYSETAHSISAQSNKVNRLNILWQQKIIKQGIVKLNVDYFSDGFDNFGRQNNKYRIAVDWTYPLN